MGSARHHRCVPVLGGRQQPDSKGFGERPDLDRRDQGPGCRNTNVGLALAFGAVPPSAPLIATAATVGFVGYGVSLVLFVFALRGLGAARRDAYLSIAGKASQPRIPL
jgi:hypothetical protein